MPSDPDPGTQPQPTKGASIWSAAIAVVLMGALVAILAIVANSFPEADDAASILGIVIPAVVSLGAAAFGVAVAYNAVGGKASAEAGAAEAAVKQQGAEAEQQQMARATQQIAAQTEAHINDIEQAVNRIVEPVQEAATSPVGERDLILQLPGEPGTSFKVRSDDIGAAEASISAARSNLEELRRGVGS